MYRERDRRHRRVADRESARRARVRGLKFTLLGFLSALVVLVAIKVKHPVISIRSPMMVLGALVAGTLIVISIAARRD